MIRLREIKKKERIKLIVLFIITILIITSIIIITIAGFTPIAGTTESTKTFEEKIGGFIKGVCHPNKNYMQIAEANIEWVRFDIDELPYDENGTPSQSYLNFKERAKGYADNGFKVMAVTPYPDKYIAAGLDPRNTENDAKIREYAAFYAKDLQGIVGAFQITNEMGIEHFTLPLTLKEAARFIGIQLQAMYPVRGDIIIGYNSAGVGVYTLNSLMLPYINYCDYVGVDIYLGCFENIFKNLSGYDIMLNYIWKLTNKPIILNEFGYIGAGDVKTAEQKQAILQKYGFNIEEEARGDIMTFINNLPEDFRNHMLGLEYSSEAELGEKLFNTELANHLYLEIQGGYQLDDYKHTWEGQGRFFTDLITRIRNMDFMYGAIVYCYSDSDACYICGQKDCPVETGWGLVDCDGNKKPAYYAVQEAFAD